MSPERKKLSEVPQAATLSQLADAYINIVRRDGGIAYEEDPLSTQYDSDELMHGINARVHRRTSWSELNAMTSKFNKFFESLEKTPPSDFNPIGPYLVKIHLVASHADTVMLGLAGGYSSGSTDSSNH